MPKQRKLIVMDEPFRNVSPEYRIKVRKMIELLSEELGVQFLIATNMRSLKTGTIIELE